jgi:hypothetical protein
MIRLSMLQLRVQAITAAVALIAFAVLLAATGPHLAGLYTASGLRGCQPGSCGQQASSFLQQVGSTGPYAAVYPVCIILIALTPAITGLFWGAPLLARELETGTFALAWSQSVTRARWLAVKLTVGGLAAMAVTEALSLLFTWWAAPIGRAAGLGGSGKLAMNQFDPLAFATHGITPIGYAAFAFALGVTAGALIRRTVPAMAVTLAIFAAVQIAMPLWIRPNLFPASHTTVAITGDSTLNLYKTGSPHTFTFTLAAYDGLPGQPEAWIRSSGAADAVGHPVGTVVPSACSAAAISGGPGPALASCLTSRGIRIAVTYQPASRYWLFQLTETGIYLGLSLALAGYCFRRLSRLS